MKTFEVKLYSKTSADGAEIIVTFGMRKEN